VTESRPENSRTCEIEQDLQKAGVPVIVSLSEAARVTGKSPDLLARLARDGTLSATKGATAHGSTGHWRVTRRDLAIYIAGGSAGEVEK